MEALLSSLKRFREEDPTTKSVVFSQWTSFLDLLTVGDFCRVLLYLTACYSQNPLKENGLKYARLDGRMTAGARQKAMEQFATAPDVTVMLISLKAGGVGINLTAASVVYMVRETVTPILGALTDMLASVCSWTPGSTLQQKNR